MTRRLEIQNLPRDIRLVITEYVGETEAANPNECVPSDKLEKRKTCSKCPAAKERKTNYKCIKCGQPICLECSRKLRTKLSVFNWLEHSHSSKCSLSVSEEITKHPNSFTRRSINSFIQRSFSNGSHSYIGKHIVVRPLCLSSRLNDAWDIVFEKNKLKVCR
ncbi:hypothetical protein J6590_079473 [Homalodisca vitripennis]|nr:hypothetical protein J6590_079473 [Homalodisca vitripennis]